MSTLEKIGQKLRSARESRGLSLGQIYDRTKIPTNNLEAIESGDFDDLPEPVYVAGFIKRYAECVGLNGQNLASEYRQGSDEEEESKNGKGIFSWGANKGAKSHRGVAVQPAPVMQTHMSKPTLSPPRPSFAKTFFYPAILIVLLTGLIVFLFYHQRDLATQQDPSLVGLRETASRYNPTSPVATPAQSPDNSTTNTDETKPPEKDDSRVSLTASQHVWVEVKGLSNGASLFTGYLEAGDRRDFQDEKGLKVRAGNGGSLNVSFKGKHQTFGAKGQVVDRVFLAKNVTEASAAETADASEAAPKPAPKPAPRKVVQKPKPKPKPKPKFRRLDSSVPSRYIPGDSLGGRRSLGMPYRYTDGRLDSE